MITLDSHTHNSFSSDSKTPMEEMARGAIHRGLNGICITDHMDYDFPACYQLRFQFDDVAHEEEVRKLQENYRDRLDIRYGVEVGLKAKKCVKDDIRNLVNRHSFDYVIGSIHVVKEMDPYYKEFWDTFSSEKEAIVYYYKETLAAIQYISDYDALGHLDYVIRYLPSKSPVNPEDYKEWIMPILKHLLAEDKAMEINTSGFKRGLQMPNPDMKILNWYRELGGSKVTIGSDAHSPEYLGDGFDLLEEMLKKNGLHQYTLYKERKPIQINF